MHRKTFLQRAALAAASYPLSSIPWIPLDHVLVSQDSGWYNVGEPKVGNYKNHNTIFDHLIPALEQNGFTKEELNGLFVTNPARAFTVGVRKL